MGFDDLVPAFMPYGATEDLSGTAGASWEWEYEVRDNAGDLVDFTGCTGTCTITDANVTITVAFPSTGVVKCTAAPSATAIAYVGRHYHEVQITNAASRSVVLVGGRDSHFTVKPGD